MTAPNRQPPDLEFVQRYAAYMRRPENIAGGSLHIVSDDFNIEDHHVKFCVDWAKGRGDTEGQYLAEGMLKMTESQRIKLIRHQYEGMRANTGY